MIETNNSENKENEDKKLALDTLTQLINEQENNNENENKKLENKKNENIENNKSKNKLKNKIPHKTEIRKCYKFTSNPQRFFTEDLCDTVLKAYDLQPKKKINTHKKNNRKIHSVSPSRRLIYNKKLIEKNKNNEKKK